MSRTQWFSEAKFGMFIHWGLYGLTDTPERMKAIAWEQIRELMTNYGQIDIL